MSQADMVASAKKAGFTSVALTTAIAVSLAEDPTSQINATNHNTDGSVDRGYWQINSLAWPQYDPNRLLTDGTYNAQAAYAISKGGKDWTPWVTYTAPANIGGKANTNSYRYYITKAGSLLGQNLDPGEAVPQGITGGIATAIAQSVNPLDLLKAFLSKITSGKFWLRIGEGAGAVAIIVFGLILLFRRQVGEGLKVAKVAAL